MFGSLIAQVRSLVARGKEPVPTLCIVGLSKRSVTAIILLVLGAGLYGAVLPWHPSVQAAAPLPTLPAAQDNDIRFEQISNEQGLSQSSVNCILQDDQGYMWFGTEDGLNRYDGYGFKVYDHDPGEPHTLSGNAIQALFQDRDGVLWIGTQGYGLNALDRRSGRVRRYRADPDDAQSLSNNLVWSIHQDRTGTLWIGTSDGLDRMVRESGRFAPYRAKELQGSTVRVIFEDQVGLLWLGTDRGLVALDPVTGSIKRYRSNSRDPLSLSGDVVWAIYQDQAGVLWIGTDGGLDRFDPEFETFRSYRNEPRDPRSLSDNAVRAIVEDRAGALWIGTVGGGLNRLDREQGTFVHYRHDPGNAYSLGSDEVLAVYEDREGVLWVGTRTAGLNKSYAGKRQFAHYRNLPGEADSLSDNFVRAIYEDRSGELWVGTAAGLDRIDRRLGRYTHYRHDPDDADSLAADLVLSIYEDRFGDLWVGTLQGGLDKFDRETGHFIHYRHNFRDPLSLSDNTVRVIYEDRAGRLWIGTDAGLNLFDRQGQYFERRVPGLSLVLNGIQIRAIQEDLEGVVWIGTSGGVIAFDPESYQSRLYRANPDEPESLSSNFVLSLHEDRAGNLWVGTFQGGLNKYNRETGAFVHFRENDGLANDVVYGILEEDVPSSADGGGRLWLSTNQGLSRFDPDTGVFKNYDVRDGLQGNEFNGGAYYQSASGEMFFGGINGFTAFYPEAVQENAYVPPIVLTSLTQGGVALAPAVSADSVRQVTLRWPHNFFEFEFAALSFVQPEKNRYAYFLEGFDQDWNDSGTRRFGTYTNLPGRTYTLRVKGSNNDGVWNEEGLALEVRVVPPFWATWWFRGLVGLVVVAGVVVGYRLRVRSVEARSRELEAQVQERTKELRREIDQRRQAEDGQRQALAEALQATRALRQSEMEQAVAAERSRIARDLHDAVTQTLFSMSLLAEALPSTWEQDEAEGRQLLTELRQSTRGVLAEMRTLLLELRPAALLETSLGDLLRQLAEATMSRESLPVGVSVQGACDLPADVHIALYRIAQESLSNAAKHARAREVTVNLQCRPADQAGQWVVALRISDDGRGFEAGCLPPDRMGLGIMAERAEAIGAVFRIDSRPGSGTRITVAWSGPEGG